MHRVPGGRLVAALGPRWEGSDPTTAFPYRKVSARLAATESHASCTYIAAERKSRHTPGSPSRSGSATHRMRVGRPARATPTRGADLRSRRAALHCRLDEARARCDKALTLADRSPHDTGSVTHHPSARRKPPEPVRRRREFRSSGEPERAARLLGAAIEFFKESGVTRQRTDKECERAAIQAMRDRLDEQTVQTLIRDGRSKPLEQVAKLELKPD